MEEQGIILGAAGIIITIESLGITERTSYDTEFALHAATDTVRAACDQPARSTRFGGRHSGRLSSAS